MVKKRLGLSDEEMKESRKAFLAALVIIVSVTVALLLEYMFGGTLQELPLTMQLAIAGSLIVLLACISVQSSKKK